MVNQKPDIESVGSISLTEYNSEVSDADKIPFDQIRPILFGLFSEVGSAMSTSKKHIREGDAYVGYRDAAIEELGDALWYFAALCRRLNISLDSVFSAAVDKFGGNYSKIAVATDRLDGAISHVVCPTQGPESDETFLDLGRSASSLLILDSNRDGAKPLLVDFAHHYLSSIQSAKLSFAEVARANSRKVRGAFLPYISKSLPTFDFGFPKDEQLPIKFAIHVNERKSGKTYLRWNDVFIGDPLTDNISDRDGYRFHDVFHLANAAVLHWSPVFRALIKHKRKSCSKTDEEQDSGRAIVVEEGLTSWVFNKAKSLNFFENQKSVSLDILKTVGEFVKGYEVEDCPLKLWEDAILQGYSAFRQLVANQGGIIVGDRHARRLKYRRK